MPIAAVCLLHALTFVPAVSQKKAVAVCVDGVEPREYERQEHGLPSPAQRPLKGAARKRSGPLDKNRSAGSRSSSGKRRAGNPHKSLRPDITVGESPSDVSQYDFDGVATPPINGSSLSPAVRRRGAVRGHKKATKRAAEQQRPADLPDRKSTKSKKGPEHQQPKAPAAHPSPKMSRLARVSFSPAVGLQVGQHSTPVAPQVVATSILDLSGISCLSDAAPARSASSSPGSDLFGFDEEPVVRRKRAVVQRASARRNASLSERGRRAAQTSSGGSSRNVRGTASLLSSGSNTSAQLESSFDFHDETPPVS